MNSKYISFLAASIFVASAGAHADTMDQDGILRKADGSTSRMSQYEALKACPQGTHLPTVREWAKLNQASGSKGILEMDQVNPNQAPDGFFKISAVNPNGQKDEFYFNHQGYRRPRGYLGRELFWSSSIMTEVSDHGYFLTGLDGSFDHDNRKYAIYFSVRCVADQP